MKGDTKYQVFSKEPGKFPKDLYEDVSKISKELVAYMDTKSFRSRVEAVHKLNGTSHEIQTLLTKKLEKLDFGNEKRGLFRDCPVPSLRPDFYMKIGKSGILVEVERGKTIANNMDILDIWKCHLCNKADFLFLIVPRVRVSQNGKPNKVFERVSKRIDTFFNPANYVNVEAVYLFGY